MPNGDLRRANLKMLFERAKQYETASFKGLYNFINFIERLKLSSGDLGAAKIIGENDNVIRIMSIHKSKGLEFPVVFLSSLGKQFNLMDLNQNILLHQEMGIGVKYIDYEKQVQYDTLSKAAIRNKIFTETLSEEMRILYVALTRAKEKLFITAIKKNYPKEIEKMKSQILRYDKNNGKINPILLKKYKKFIDWILLVYYYEESNIKNIVDLEIFNKKDIIKDFSKIEDDEINVIKELENVEIKKEEIEKIDKILNYKYNYILSTKIPTKTSVTKIKELKNEEKGLKNIDLQEITFQTPNFMKEQDIKLTSAQKGTLLHLCMQNLDAKKVYSLSTIKELIEELKAKKIITENEALNINPYQILAFTKTNIWEQLKEAKEINKEKPFYINIPAKEIYNKDIDEMVLVQGVIDLYFINKENELILLDYKTDYVEQGKEDELLEKYADQLKIYKKALEESLNRKVDKVYIYSVYLNKACQYLEK